MKEFLRASEAADMLRVTPQTIRKYHKQGKIKGYPTPGGQTVYKTSEIREQMQDAPTNNTPQASAHYCRASDGNKARLATQEEQLAEKYGEPDYLIKDRASGLNEKRNGLWRMIELAKQGKITTIRVTQKDRLTRFGYLYLEELFAAYGVEIVVAFAKEDKSLAEELMQDFMSLIASFAGKFYRLRGYEQQKELLATAAENIEEKEAAGK